MLDCGFSPPMSSLSDRNMRLGDVMLPPRGKQRCLYLRVQGLFTSHSIVFWERDITSEHLGTPVHISTTVYTFKLLSIFTFSCSHHYHYLLCLIICKQQGRRD